MADTQKIELIEAAFARLAAAVQSWLTEFGEVGHLPDLWSRYNSKLTSWLQRYQGWPTSQKAEESTEALDQSLEELRQLAALMREIVDDDYAMEVGTAPPEGYEAESVKLSGLQSEFHASVRALEDSFQGCLA